MAAAEFVVDFPTLGDLIDGWIKQHCLIPDGFARGRPFEEYDWQFWCTANHYRVREGAVWTADEPPLNQAFVHRRSQIIAPQKTGKGPWSAAITANEAVGPSLFAGWAKAGEAYDCAEHGCSCGWGWDYESGEPKGMRHPSPLIQLTATSQEQVDNVYRPLTSMIHMGPLKHLLKVRESFIRIVGDSDDPDMDRIDAVTSSALSRLGNPVTFALHDESGLYTAQNKMRKVAETQRRGAAGMGGRTMETTNPWDPSENSVAQTTFESRSPDIFKFYRPVPPKPDGTALNYRDKRERQKIHRYVYDGSTHVNLASIEAEARELLEHDPTQAERFFGNRIVHGLGSWLPDGLWGDGEDLPLGSAICLGFDGSESGDWTAIRAETFTGHRFTPTYGPNSRPTIWNPAEWGGSIPRGEVHAAVDEICNRFRVSRAYCDPKGWQSEIADWALKYGEDVFVEWATYRTVQMHAALERSVTDLISGRSTHDKCLITATHVGNARKLAKPGDRYILGKPSDHQKIDAAMADVLAHEAAADARAAGWTDQEAFSYGWASA